MCSTDLKPRSCLNIGRKLVRQQHLSNAQREYGTSENLVMSTCYLGCNLKTLQDPTLFSWLTQCPVKAFCIYHTLADTVRDREAKALDILVFCNPHYDRLELQPLLLSHLRLDGCTVQKHAHVPSIDYFMPRPRYHLAGHPSRHGTAGTTHNPLSNSDRNSMMFW